MTISDLFMFASSLGNGGNMKLSEFWIQIPMVVVGKREFGSLRMDDQCISRQ